MHSQYIKDCVKGAVRNITEESYIYLLYTMLPVRKIP